MDRLVQLTAQLSEVIEQLHTEARDRDARDLMAPLAWLDEANSWLRYEMECADSPARRDGVPFTYIPVGFRR